MYHEFIDRLQPQILAATRQQIVEATVGLHEAIGGDRTTIGAIAEQEATFDPVQFSTWQSVEQGQGLDTGQAGDLMLGMVRCAATHDPF